MLCLAVCQLPDALLRQAQRLVHPLVEIVQIESVILRCKVGLRFIRENMSRKRLFVVENHHLNREDSRILNVSRLVLLQNPLLVFQQLDQHDDREDQD